MKNFSLLLVVIFGTVFISFSGCTKENKVNDSGLVSFDIDTVNFTHSMKGWELYSWLDENDFSYSILMGTNRSKTNSEVIHNKIAVNGLDSLKRLLARMPAGEVIFWNSYPESCSMPNQEIIDEITDFCSTRNILLQEVTY